VVEGEREESVDGRESPEGTSEGGHTHTTATDV
jgi:hypothetical protein